MFLKYKTGYKISRIFKKDDQKVIPISDSIF